MVNFLSKPIYAKIILFTLVFIYYGNTINNGFVLDDVLFITHNKYVKNGINGIPDIIMHDSFHGATGQTAKTSGGRYRPLSLVSFALEKEFFGKDADVFHFFNIIYYTILILLIYGFLIRHVIPNNNLLAFYITLLFLIHPVHTEVVANIKSRDEILSLIFQIISLNYLLKYSKSGGLNSLIISVISLALALLSKENSIILLLMIPLAYYIFSGFNFKTSLLKSSLHFVIILGYLVFRYYINKTIVVEENNVMNNPYAFVEIGEKLGTIFWVLLKYLGLIFYPNPLSYDYSYNQVAYINLVNPVSILSILIHIALFIYGILLCIKKSAAGFFILFYLAALFLVSNLLVNIGTPLAERFLFSPSFYLITTLLLLIYPLLNKLKFCRISILLPVTVILILVTYTTTTARNKDWKSNKSLFFKDIKVAPKSVRALTFCGITLMQESGSIQDSILRLKSIRDAISYFNSAYTIYKDFYQMYNDWGGAYYMLNMIDSAQWAWGRLKVLRPDSQFNLYNDEVIAKYYYQYYNNKCNEALLKKDYSLMLTYYREAIKHYDKMPESWVYLGELFRINNKPDSAVYCWNRALEEDPGNEKAAMLLKKYQVDNQ